MDKVISVSQFNNYVSGMFEDELVLQDISIIGEVDEIKVRSSISYIVLKENDYILNCVKFSAVGDLQPGDNVTIRGSASFYAKGSKVSFIVRDYKICGQGDNRAKLESLKRNLAHEGLFEHRLTLPRLVRKVAFISSITGAVIHDFISVLRRCGCGYIDIIVFSVKVQGDKTDLAIASAIADVHKYSLDQPIDLIVIARGGGSNSDLDAFNSEIVARSVAESRIPVISAIGHEIDYTLCDLCAGTRAGTPSIAADMISRLNQSFFDLVYGLIVKANELVIKIFQKKERTIIYNANRTLSIAEHSIKELAERIACNNVAMYESIKDRAGSCYARMIAALQSASDNVDDKMSVEEKSAAWAFRILDELSPLKLLDSGYSVASIGEKRIGSIDDVKVGDEISIRVSDGTISTNVFDVQKIK